MPEETRSVCCVPAKDVLECDQQVIGFWDGVRVTPDPSSGWVPRMASPGSADPLAPALEPPTPHLPFSPPTRGRCIEPPEKCGQFSDCNLSTLTSSPTSELVYVATVTERGVNG